MRLLYLGNNWLGLQILRWLKHQQEEIVGLVVHPSERQKFTSDILEVANLPPHQIFDGSQLRQTATLEAIKALQPDLGISVLFGYILRSDFLALFPRGCLNLHPSYLPYNRGAFPNVWSIIEDTPAGVTLHYLDAGIDTGPIVAQCEVPVDIVDTGQTLYQKLEQAAENLFQETWPLLKTNQVSPIEQSAQAGTHHFTRDVERIDEIMLDKSYTARELLNLLRARTFPPHPGAYFVTEGRKVFLQLKLLYEDQSEREK